MAYPTTAPKAQTLYHAQDVDIRLQGTSTLHDWEMKAGKGNTEAVFVIDAANKILSLSKLTFTLPVKNLKSEHTVMDKNTYKALQADANPSIQFVLSSATIVPATGNEYKIECVGKLTIAGTTHETTLTATAVFNAVDKSLLISGVKKMKMTDYNVKPPTVMLGTIKTGNDIAILFSVKLIK